MFRVLGGADATGGFMQHEIPRRFASLQQHVITFNATESPYFMVWIADDAAIDPYPFFDQEQADLLAAELGQVAQKTVYAHDARSQKIEAGILPEAFRLRGRQLVLHLRAAGTQAGQVLLGEWQGLQHLRVDTDAVAPAGLFRGIGAGHRAVVARPAGRAEIRRGHGWGPVIDPAIVCPSTGSRRSDMPPATPVRII